MISYIFSSVFLLATLLLAECARIPDISPESHINTSDNLEIDIISDDIEQSLVPCDHSHQNATLQKRSLFSCFWFGRKVSPNDSMEKYTLIGYHGTSSKYHQSMEKKLVIRHHTLYNRRQLGHTRFYTANDAQTAEVYAERTVKASTSGGYTPLLCRIYIQSSALPNIPKIYVPHSVDIAGHWEADLWQSDKYLDRWESLLFSDASPEHHLDGSTKFDLRKSETVRFSKMVWQVQFLLNTIGIQAAWPEEAVRKMVAKCGSFDTKGTVAVGYNKVIEKSQTVDYDPLWGRVRGSTYFKLYYGTGEDVKF
ncbi:hypothetical protein BKA69DRAFT_415809 [Paraphysoderma sedebokerense]|nr:hypothetical protein BKA69DRAFT_415809 [Paraphysoderma sedebokerense]